ncbi:cyclodeaminase/cyclohydrolase family protein [Actinoallomurus sp. NBC_01490]|uniref:cyclodeaminase/cyclohydrolase family protein n=1 Tax=Actinoallomurus sp. NBC_01490 TaxID=2903557 RepID=UPI002E314250|nr:cyclodeaminase/cyclohydrolase family protein [Actinoallomurus sp. NBC_01490]
MNEDRSLLPLSVADLLAAVAKDEPAPGGGAVAAVAAALAAALAGMAARYAQRSSPDQRLPRGLAEQADALCSRAARLADADTDAYREYVSATRLSRSPDPEPRRRAITAALDAAAAVPSELASLAEEIADLGRRLAFDGNPRLRSDACTTALVAAAAAAGAALLVADNLAARPGDRRITAAADSAARARKLADAALSGPNAAPERTYS